MTEIARRPGARTTLRRAGVIAAETDSSGIGGEIPSPVPAPSQPEREFTVKARGQWSLILRRFLHHRLAVVSLVVFVFIVVMAFVGGNLWKYSYDEIPPDAPASAPPTLDVIPWLDGDGLAIGDHPFGTETIGKDMLALTLRGAQKSVQIALMVAFISTTIAVIVGGIAGYFRGKTDFILMRFVDLLLTIPLIAIAAVLSRQVKGGDWWLLAVILGLTLWLGTARIIRGEFLSLREKEFVEAARAMGAKDSRIIFKHMLPNVVGPMIVAATLAVALAILVETALSYLGMGVKAPDTSLGLLVSDYQSAFKTRPWLFWFPGVTILIIALCINFIGDGLRDAFDPKQTRVRA